MTNRILIRPVITEKSMLLVSNGKYMFEVGKKANKKEIAQAVHKIFGVDVESVRTNIRPGKTKRLVRQRKTTRTPAKKFAIVTLVKGQRIAGFDDALEIEEGEEE